MNTFKICLILLMIFVVLAATLAAYFLFGYVASGVIFLMGIVSLLFVVLATPSESDEELKYIERQEEYWVNRTAKK